MQVLNLGTVANEKIGYSLIFAELVVVAYVFDTKILDADGVLVGIQLRSPDAIRMGWNATWVEAWSKAMDFL